MMRTRFCSVSKLSKSSHWPEISSKKRKRCDFHKNCTKPSFQVMRNRFWPNRIFQCQSCQNRHTGLKFSLKRENSALFIKIVPNPFFRSCAARFWASKFSKSSHWPEILSKKRKTVRFPWKLYKTLFSGHAQHAPNRILSVKVVKIVTLASNSLQNRKTVRFPWKLYKTLFSDHAQQVFAKSHFWASKLSKSSHWPEILLKTGKQCAFHENCTKRSFQVMRSTFWPNRIFERQSSQNRHTGLKFSSKTGKQCAFHENCTKRSFQVMRSTFWPNRIFERQSSQNRHTGLKFSPKEKTVRFLWKLYKTLFSGHAQHVLAKSHFWASKFSKIVTLAWNSLQNGKTVRFPWKLYKTLFSGHAQHVLAKSHFWASKLSKSSHWPQILFKKGKQCAFHKNCTKPSFQVMRSTFWPNRICERQSSPKSSHWPQILSKNRKTVRFP